MIGISPILVLVCLTLMSRPAPLPASKPTWTGPPNMSIYLSTIELPDLKPKPKPPPLSKTQTPAQASIQPKPHPSLSNGPSRLPVLAKPDPQAQQTQLPQIPSHPPRSDRPGGSISAPNGTRPPPPLPVAATDVQEHRKTSFGRMLNNLVRQ